MAIRSDGFLEERVESLYVAPEYNLFLLTGQPLGNSRRAYISAKPFNALTPDKLEAFNAAAQPLDAGSRITISPIGASLQIRDGFTGTTSSFPISALDSEVQRRLSAASEARWDKFAAPAATKPAPKRTFNL